MQQLKIIYVYDALCGWCYGFTPVMLALQEQYHDRFDFEVLSGGMMLGPRSGPIGVVASFIKDAYRRVEETTGVEFGEGFLRNVDRGEMILDSEKPAIALSVFKHYQEEKALQFAHELQNAINFDGKDPNTEEIYRYIAVNHNIDPDEFEHLMHQEEYKKAAHYEFALAKQLKVEGYPAAFIQSADDHFYQIAKGFADLETMEVRVENVLKEIGKF